MCIPYFVPNYSKLSDVPQIVQFMRAKHCKFLYSFFHKQNNSKENS